MKSLLDKYMVEAFAIDNHIIPDGDIPFALEWDCYDYYAKENPQLFLSYTRCDSLIEIATQDYGDVVELIIKKLGIEGPAAAKLMMQVGHDLNSYFLASEKKLTLEQAMSIVRNQHHGVSAEKLYDKNLIEPTALLFKEVATKLGTKIQIVKALHTERNLSNLQPVIVLDDYEEGFFTWNTKTLEYIVKNDFVEIQGKKKQKFYLMKEATMTSCYYEVFPQILFKAIENTFPHLNGISCLVEQAASTVEKYLCSQQPFIEDCDASFIDKFLFSKKLNGDLDEKSDSSLHKI